jgi:ABC-type glutathione transport system ATPase component
LDVPVQNQILELLLSLREKRDLTLIMITHDLTVMSAVSDRVAVMRGGRIVQEGLPLEIIRSDNAYVRELRRSADIF